MKYLSELIAFLSLGASPALADDVVFLAADESNEAQASLATFLAEELAGSFDLRTELLVPGENGSITGLESLANAELLVVFADAHPLTAADRTTVETYLASGLPILAIRSGCVGFDDFDEYTRGGAAVNYLGQWRDAAPPVVRRLPSANEHPIVAGLDIASLKAHGPLYRVTPLAETATPLLMGQALGVKEPEPVAWTTGYNGSRSFATSLGSPGDFAEPVFREMLRRAVFWCLGREDLDGHEPVPVLDESNSVSIFDGESLEGWTTHGGRYDGNARWTVEDGVIVGRQGPHQSGGLLYTNRPYDNFILSFETWIDYPFDSGVFLHMVPRGGGKGIQVTLDYRPGGQIGGIYADGYLQENPDSTDLLEREAWNQVVVRCVDNDMHVTAWLDGELLVDYVTPKGMEGFADTGLIGVQVHGGEHVPDSTRAMFRNLRIRELPHYDSELFSVDDHGILTTTEAGAKAGWVSMFNGRDLSGWDPRPAPESYRVEEGVLVFPAEGGNGEIRSLKEYRDFELRLDFKIAKGANSGLFLRSGPDGNPSYSGCEIQILDDFNWETLTNSTLRDYQFSGGLYAAKAPKIKTALRPLGDWNTYKVRYVGSQISVRLNGYLLYDVDTFELEADPPFQDRVERGFIGLQRHGIADSEQEAFAWFRNIFVKELGEHAGTEINK